MTGKEITALMRRHKVTIRQLSRRMGITQKRIREARAAGLADAAAARDWVEAITGKDPGAAGSPKPEPMAGASRVTAPPEEEAPAGESPADPAGPPADLHFRPRVWHPPLTLQLTLQNHF